MADKETLSKLKKLTLEYRKGIINLSFNKKQSIHIGGIFSCAEMLVTLFHHTLNIDPKNPDWDERDRFILSKGHCGVGLYYVMGQRNYFPLAELHETFKEYNSRFSTHLCKNAFSALDISSGSLGHGLPIAVGMALAAKIDERKHRVFCMVGDGELQEGSNWEAAMSAPRFKLGNLILIVDRNRFSMDGLTEKIMPLDPLAKKWEDFNWKVIEINGNELEEVADCFDNLPASCSDVPTVVIANTVKGKGISFMENNALYHNAKIDPLQYDKVMAELEKIG